MAVRTDKSKVGLQCALLVVRPHARAALLQKKGIHATCVGEAIYNIAGDLVCVCAVLSSVYSHLVSQTNLHTGTTVSRELALDIDEADAPESSLRRVVTESVSEPSSEDSHVRREQTGEGTVLFGFLLASSC